MRELIEQRLHALGPLRTVLHAVALLAIVLMPFADVRLSPEGWGLFFGAALPAVAPLIFMVLMLDVLMCQVSKAEADAVQRARLGFIVKLHLVIACLLLLVWLPVFLKATYF